MRIVESFIDKVSTETNSPSYNYSWDIQSVPGTFPEIKFNSIDALEILVKDVSFVVEQLTPLFFILDSLQTILS